MRFTVEFYSIFIGLISSLFAAEVEKTDIVFTDQARATGVHFVHVNGASEEKHLPETMGAGGLFLDYDSDGDLDIYLVNSGSFIDDKVDQSATNALYRNDGDGTFTDVTETAGVAGGGYGMGCISADYDNDGDPDLYVTNFGQNRLYRNNGDGTFTDVTAQAGVGDPRWSVSASFGDLDRDGDLDLYVANYLDYALETEHPCYLKGIRMYCGPYEYPGERDTLYRNNGDGSFTDITESAGVMNQGKGLGVLFTDYNGDGYPDIFVANDAIEDFLYQNNGDGSFTDVAKAVGVAYNSEGITTASMGIANGDYDSDGLLDLFVTTFSLEVNSLFHNDGNGFYTMTTFDVGLAEPSFAALGFGTQFVDCDNDSDLDLFVANGHVWDNVGQITPGLAYKQPCQLFRNDGQGQFSEVTKHAGQFFALRRVARGTAIGDYNNDGRLDVLVTYCGESPALLRNDSVSRNHWIGIKLVGTQSNRDGIGSKVRIHAGDKMQVKEVTCGGSYASDSDHSLHFGLGAQTTVQRIEVTWPNGDIQTLENHPADQVMTIVESR